MVDFVRSLFQIPSNTEDLPAKSTKTARAFINRIDDKETGWDRIRIMFSLDENGSISTELNSIYQASLYGLLTGVVYGGFVQSRIAYLDFMENNQATAFKSHFDAKRKLQDQVTINFAKGAFRWGWRLTLFTASYVGITTAISCYRNKSSVIEYATAGGVTGALYKYNLGLRGLAVGSLVGTVLGGVAGCCSLLILRMTGRSMEEVRYWQYKWKQDRDLAVSEAMKAQSIEKDDDIMITHNANIKKHDITLDSIPTDDKNTTK